MLNRRLLVQTDDPLHKREQFAVNLRKKRRSLKINEKRQRTLIGLKQGQSNFDEILEKSMNRADVYYEMYHEFMRDPVSYTDRVKQISPGFDSIMDVVSEF